MDSIGSALCKDFASAPCGNSSIYLVLRFQRQPIVPQSLGAVMFLLSSSSEVMFSRSLTVFITLLLTFLSGPVSVLKHSDWLWDTVLIAVRFHCTIE